MISSATHAARPTKTRCQIRPGAPHLFVIVFGHQNDCIATQAESKREMTRLTIPRCVLSCLCTYLSAASESVAENKILRVNTKRSRAMVKWVKV